MNKESKHLWSMREIEEYYTKEGEDVYYHWRIPSMKDDKWHKEFTGHKEIPWVEFPVPPTE